VGCAREKLLAGPDSPRKRTVELVRATILILSRTERIASLSPRIPCWRGSRLLHGLRTVPSQGGSVRHEAFTIACDDLMQTHGLTHQIGNHCEKSHVLVNRKSALPSKPDQLSGTITRSRSLIGTPMNETVDPILPCSRLPIRKEQTVCDIFYDDRHLCGDDLTNCPFGYPSK